MCTRVSQKIKNKNLIKSINVYGFSFRAGIHQAGTLLQVWATWLFYVDLGDAVADEMEVPFDSISKGMQHFAVAYNKGKASDRVSYFAAPENQDLRVVKIRKK